MLSIGADELRQPWMSKASENNVSNNTGLQALALPLRECCLIPDGAAWVRVRVLFYVSRVSHSDKRWPVSPEDTGGLFPADQNWVCDIFILTCI